ncbi:phosphoenolpyruvate--protein phosphotransferase [Brevibacillus borstelensis]|uniref:phosphoenolpyruvate--protein phosphotransferase n=1 Tax=Brevibacillus borstelensis TaxID=45462 RepID=UPI0030BC87D6
MFKGIPVSAGIAIAPIVRLAAQPPVAAAGEKIDANRIAEELQSLERSIALAREQLSGLKEKAMDQLGPEKAAILSAHIAFLDDPSFAGEMKARIENQLCSAPAAVQAVAEQFIALFEGMDNEYMRERADDIRDVSRRLLRNLSSGDSHFAGFPEEPFILAGEDVTPSETLQLPLAYVKGIATAKGGPTSHAAILARSLGIPAVMGGGEAFLAAAETSQMMILDGTTGELWIAPSEEQLSIFREKARQEADDREALDALKDLPAVTLDGHRVHVAANMAVPEEAEALVASGLDGVGLFRSEFLFMDRDSLPDEEEQFDAYKRVVSAFQGKPVIIRTLDAGGDKHLPAMALPKEENPFLGFRAIRISLARPELFRTQLRALLRASAFGRLLIMFPMISHVEQLREAKRLLEEAKEELRMSKAPFDEQLAVGMMMEIPSACLQADAFAKEVQFFSIGTNDLVQYTLAVDRMNESIAHLYSYYHPAVLRLIAHVIDASHRAGIWTGLCGEMAGDPLATELLLGMGLDEFSGAAAVMPKVKARIRSTTIDQARKVARYALSLSSAGDVYRYLHDKTE